jgi:hypothetical protein
MPREERVTEGIASQDEEVIAAGHDLQVVALALESPHAMPGPRAGRAAARQDGAAIGQKQLASRVTAGGNRDGRQEVAAIRADDAVLRLNGRERFSAGHLEQMTEAVEHLGLHLVLVGIITGRDQ